MVWTAAQVHESIREEPILSSDSEPVVESDFANWYATAYPRLVASLRLATGVQLTLVEDAAAEAFVRALERWRRVSQMESPTGWTYRVAQNVIRRRVRRARIEMAILRRAAPPEALTIEAATDGDLWHAIRALPPRGREAVALRYFAGFTEAEVAKTMRITEGAVSAHLVRARRTLKARLGERER